MNNGCFSSLFASTAYIDWQKGETYKQTFRQKDGQTDRMTDRPTDKNTIKKEDSCKKVCNLQIKTIFIPPFVLAAKNLESL